MVVFVFLFFFFQAEDGIRDLVRSRGLGDVYKRQDEVVVAAVGAGLKQTPGLAAKIFSAIAGQNINIEMISLGASDVATYFIVKEPCLVPAVNALHTAFFTNSIN